MKKQIAIVLLLIVLAAFFFSGCQAQDAAPSAASSATPISSAPSAETPSEAPQETQSAQPQESSVAAVQAPEPPELYDYDYLQSLDGGFTDTISSYAEEQGMTVDEFRALCEKPASEMTEEELTSMNAIRDKQIIPDADTLMQKVITTYDMEKYLSGEYKTPKGFVSVCADVKQYHTTQDMYYGLRLDYDGTYFKPEGENYAVIRFYAANIDQATIPKSPANGGTVEDPYPFGGAGFTTGTNGRWGSPEWTMAEFTVLNDYAQLFEVQEDGTEILRGVYLAEAGQFVPVEE